MTNDEQPNESEDELRHRAEESFNTGATAFRRGDYSEALSSFENALVLYQGVADAERDQAGFLYNSGIVLKKLGDWRGALGRLDQALALYRGLPGTERDQAGCLLNSGVALGESGDWRGALGRFEQALTLLDQSVHEADRIDVERISARCVRSIGVCLVNLDEAVFPDHFARLWRCSGVPST